MSSLLEQYAQALEERASTNNLRSLRACRTLPEAKIELNGKVLVNFASNDYLGLSQSEKLKERAIEYTRLYGVGNGASRLLSGNHQIFEKIEKKLAALKGTQTALILPSGFQTNSSLIPSLLQKESPAFADRLVHRSIIEGLLLSKSRFARYRHNDNEDLQNRLSSRNSEDKEGWIFTESVFSMDGDRCDLPALLSTSKQERLALYVDEAHATGVLGRNGMGLTAGLEFNGISMGTFGKGLGSFGAYICSSTVMRDYLINFFPGLIYSTALPPPVLGAIDAALDLVPDLDKERERLAASADTLRHGLKKMGFDCGASSTQIIPIILSSSAAAIKLSQDLENAGFYVPAIRPPTVAEGSARLRLSLTVLHSKEQIEDFQNTLRRWHEKKS
ncbi:MAG: 8-amino-7-oxononanoate synthase [Candidatus Obscuribacterales bacterium]|nr:8-amino-7-oxononanoate synthase [Candidatus Obscuribacterales bacterium]